LLSVCVFETVCLGFPLCIFISTVVSPVVSFRRSICSSCFYTRLISSSLNSEFAPASSGCDKYSKHSHVTYRKQAEHIKRHYPKDRVLNYRIRHFFLSKNMSTYTNSSNSRPWTGQSSHIPMTSRSRPATSTRPRTSQSRPSTMRPVTSASSRQESNFIIAIIEGRGVSREIGMACLDKDTGRVVLVQVL
jgi:hypothetical protein